MNKKRSKRLDVLRTMPPMRHSFPDRPFNVFESEALSWVLKQPDLLNYFWDTVTRTGYIAYNRETGTWQGAATLEGPTNTNEGEQAK